MPRQQCSGTGAAAAAVPARGASRAPRAGAPRSARPCGRCCTRRSSAAAAPCGSRCTAAPSTGTPPPAGLSAAGRRLRGREQGAAGMITSRCDQKARGGEAGQWRDELDELGGLADATKRAADTVDVHRLVDQRLGRQSEAVLLPVGVVVDFGPQDLLHEVLRVGAVNRDCAGVGHVGAILAPHGLESWVLLRVLSRVQSPPGAARARRAPPVSRRRGTRSQNRLVNVSHPRLLFI
eukprot:scaffold9770_cov110-Isochrysis_galbana.AAC.2